MYSGVAITEIIEEIEKLKENKMTNDGYKYMLLRIIKQNVARIVTQVYNR